MEDKRLVRGVGVIWEGHIPDINADEREICDVAVDV